MNRRHSVEYTLIALGFTVFFWTFREHSFSGDWRGWIRYLEAGLWYRLREPISLAIYQIPYQAFRSAGVSAQGVLASTSCLLGGLSMAYAWATLKRVTKDPRVRIFGLLALVASYGVSGVLFGHVEHYAIMSLGCFAYLYYSIRYLEDDLSIFGAGFALACLGTTHLMAAWLVPSLLALPWIKSDREVGSPSPVRDLTFAIASFGIPNLLVWGVIIALYYDANVMNLVRDALDGGFSKQVHGVGNALGGGNNKGFLTVAEIFSAAHCKGMLALLFLYSPVAIVGCLAALTGGGREARDGLRTPTGRLLLLLLVPYLFYAWTWEPGLGYAQDWDLFSHLGIFAVFMMVLLLARVREIRWVRIIAGLGLVLSSGLTSYVVAENHDADSPTGVWSVLSSAGIDVERVSKPGAGARR